MSDIFLTDHDFDDDQYFYSAYWEDEEPSECEDCIYSGTDVCPHDPANCHLLEGV